MGGGAWDSHVYHTTASTKADAGVDTFTYSSTLWSKPAHEQVVHPSLDPKLPNLAGENVREANCSDEHPNATPIAVFLDVTGSMLGIPRVLVEKLPQLHGVLQRRGYVDDPQILFGAIGDANDDRFPLQVGQFESDNRMDEQLTDIILEGGGGGGNHESYELAAYYLAKHSRLGINAEGRKGYLFIIGNERIYSEVDSQQVARFIGDTLQENIPTKNIFAELAEMYHVFFLFATQGTTRQGEVLNGSMDSRAMGWLALLGQNALVLEDADAVCEVIAMTLGVNEGAVTVDEAATDLADAGFSPGAILSASTALAAYATTNTAVASVEGNLPATTATGADRL